MPISRPLLMPALAALMIVASLPMLPRALAAETPSRLDVQAQAELQVVPDRATLSARLWEKTPAIARREDSANDPGALREARERLEARAAGLIRTLEEAGLEREAIRAGSLNVQPEHLPGARRTEGEQETLVRTRLERPIRLQLDDLEQLPGLLDALTEAGVDALDGVSYDLADRDGATDEALVKALKKARRKARLMAETLDIELGEIITVSETRSPVFQPRMMAMSADARESAPQAEYRPGTITIEAGVSVSWEITP
ncbi:SIMPL domain-containing protein [Halomonas lysinitropha]|uniref:Oxidative stress defense protein n=1 Tax=Halomonas lysinitropha TaxID=2607506 RepID=A0A5K1I2Q3_9GAMM|nr:SIMPL domain-containing protein [Halomonas lysinitropha]VVZ95725.1 oxidative stress defense protein [Halomonas lysinitropha]